MNEVFSQMRDMFEKDNFVAKRNMIEQHQMLMNLAHITDVRHDW